MSPIIIDRKILAVVDDLMFHSKITGALEPHGYRVTLLGDTKAASEHARSHRPNLVIVDLGLGRGNPFELIRTLKQELSLPVLAFTRHTDMKGQKQAAELGCDKVAVRSEFFDKMSILVGSLTLAAEHRAVRSSAGLIDQSYRGKLRLTGKDRVEFLHGLVTNDIKRLKPGEGCYAAFTNVKAHMLSDGRVYALADSLLIDLEPDTTQKIQKHMDKYIITSDVTIEDLTQKWGLLSVYGPSSRDLLQDALGSASWPESEYGTIEIRLGSTPLLAARNEITGEPGYDLYFPSENLPDLWSRLIRSGAVPVGQEALDALRIEAGIPRYGADMDESHFPMEAGIEPRAISYTKGCYLGQEPIARADAKGHMNRYLVGLIVEEQVVPDRGRPILIGDRTIGSVTSGIWSPGLNQVIALGYVHRDFSQPGTAVSIGSDGRPIPAVVTALPFYKRAK